jgi:hypothetical protein
MKKIIFVFALQLIASETGLVLAKEIKPQRKQMNYVLKESSIVKEQTDVCKIAYSKNPDKWNRYYNVSYIQSGISDDSIKKSAIKTLSIKKKELYTMTISQERSIKKVKVVRKSDKKDAGAVYFDVSTGKVLKTETWPPLLDVVAIKTLKQNADKNGWDKDNKKFDIVKEEQGGSIRYQVSGSVDGGFFGTFFFDKDLKFVRKKKLTDPGFKQ